MPRVGLEALVLGRPLGLVRLPLVELDVQEVLVVVLVAHRRVLQDSRKEVLVGDLRCERPPSPSTPSRRRVDGVGRPKVEFRTVRVPS